MFEQYVFRKTLLGVILYMDEFKPEGGNRKIHPLKEVGRVVVRHSEFQEILVPFCSEFARKLALKLGSKKEKIDNKKNMIQVKISRNTQVYSLYK